MKMVSEREQGKREFHLKIREMLKRKRPEFRRQCSHKIKSVRKNWRYPEGIHSKIREKRAGHTPLVETGYRSPKSIRGLHKSGLNAVHITCLKGIETVGKDEGIIISGKISAKKRLQIIAEAKKRNIAILNLEADTYLKKIEEKKRARELEKKERKEEKGAKKKEKPRLEKKEMTEKAEEKKEEVEKEEEKRERERREIEKILITKT